LVLVCSAAVAGDNNSATAYLTQVSPQMLTRTPGGTSFHLKAHFSAKGDAKNTGDGTYEETWISPDKWRKDITFGSYKLTLVRKGDTTYRLSPKADLPATVAEMQWHILPDLPAPAKLKLMQQKTKLGGTDVIRVANVPQTGDRINLPDFSWYFSAPANALVMQIESTTVTTYSRIGALAGKIAGADFNVTMSDKSTVDFTTDSLAAVTTADDTLFAVPDNTDKTALGSVQVLTMKDLGKKKASGPDPQTPDNLKLIRLEGHVVLQATINTDGSVRDLEVASASDPRFIQPALDAVNQWKYKPTLVEGVAVQVQGPIDIDFRLGNW
jgi:TonB family protein